MDKCNSVASRNWLPWVASLSDGSEMDSLVCMRRVRELIFALITDRLLFARDWKRGVRGRLEMEATWRGRNPQARPGFMLSWPEIEWSLGSRRWRNTGHDVEKLWQFLRRTRNTRSRVVAKWNIWIQTKVYEMGKGYNALNNFWVAFSFRQQGSCTGTVFSEDSQVFSYLF